MTPPVLSLTELLILIRQQNTTQRQLIAIAAPPAAGKSTLAQLLVNALNQQQEDCAKVVPMDGFHLDNRILVERGLITRKGSPETFDALGFLHLIQRLKVEKDVVIPLFDRERDLSIAGADLIQEQHKIVVVEGNYLLLQREPWQQLQALWDLSIWLEVDTTLLERRLIERWLGYGLSEEAAKAKALLNDLPNAHTTITESKPADYVLKNF